MNVLNRAALSHPAFTGVLRHHLAELLVELAPRWEAARESQLAERRGGARRREAGAGRKQKLVFTDRLLVTLVHLRHQLPHTALAEPFAVDRSTTIEDVFAEAEGVELRLDGAETQVRRPRAGRPGRRAFVSGKRRRNTLTSSPS